MTRLIGCLITLGTLPWLGALQGAVQETLVPPLEIKQDQTLYNYQSLRGCQSHRDGGFGQPLDPLSE